MHFTKIVSVPLVKFGKGFLLVHVILFSAVFISQSCKKNEVGPKDGAADRMLKAVKVHNEILGSIKCTRSLLESGLAGIPSDRIGLNSKLTSSSSSYNSGQDQQIVYINFPEFPKNPEFTYDINGMATLVSNYQGVVTYQPTSNSYIFNIPLNEVRNSLNPLITEARTYLHAKGLTDSEINQMIIDEGGQEVDLVPFATTLAEYEKSGTGYTGMNYMSLLGNSVYAGDVFKCAMAAVGADLIYALGGSNATKWSKAALKKAFGTIAKRALGQLERLSPL